MIKLLFFCLLLIFTYQIISKPAAQKLSWFLAGILFVPNYVILVNSPQISFYKALIYIILLVCLKFTTSSDFINKFPFSKVFIFVLFIYLIIGFSDSRVSLFYQIYRSFNFFVERFFIMYIAWFFIKEINDFRYIFDRLYLFFVVLCIYGICNFLTRSNEFNELLSAGFGAVDFANYNMREDAERFRVASFTPHPIYYGFLLNVILLMDLYIITTFKHSRNQIYKHFFLMFLLLINLILVNSRTPILAFLFGSFIYVIFALKTKYKMRIIVSTSVLILFSFFVSTNARTLLINSINAFSQSDSDSQFKNGSSIEMRERQLEASLLIFAQSPITGHGFNYIQEGLGYSSDKENRESGAELYGFESYSYKLLIEEGVLGIFANLVFVFVTLVWLLKMRSKVNSVGLNTIFLAIGLLMSFVAFILGTGDLGTFVFFMTIFGMYIKLIMLSTYNSSYV